MIILGVDPGTIVTGYGIIQFHKNTLSFLDQGAIKPPSTKPIAFKLEMIYNELNSIIKQFKPDEFAIETAFYSKNIQSVMKISYVRAVAMLAAVHNKIPLSEYSPREIKRAVTGNGAAAKKQVQYMVFNLLKIKNKEMLFDESDALAVALCHSFRAKAPASENKSWKSFIQAHPDRIIS
ncbi:MAG: crossover junction endodeoxyribonuclease RuvC [Methanococcaceae archaeon]